MMRGDNNRSIDSLWRRISRSDYLVVVVVFFLPPDKLTGLLPVLSPGEQGVPLPKVAAHVTGVAPFTEPVAAAAAAADGEGPQIGCRGLNMRRAFLRGEPEPTGAGRALLRPCLPGGSEVRNVPRGTLSSAMCPPPPSAFTRSKHRPLLRFLRPSVGD